MYVNDESIPTGRTGVPVYDGSWTEWGAEDSGCPVDGAVGDK